MDAADPEAQAGRLGTTGNDRCREGLKEESGTQRQSESQADAEHILTEADTKCFVSWYFRGARTCQYSQLIIWKSILIFHKLFDHGMTISLIGSALKTFICNLIGKQIAKLQLLNRFTEISLDSPFP